MRRRSSPGSGGPVGVMCRAEKLDILRKKPLLGAGGFGRNGGGRKLSLEESPLDGCNNVTITIPFSHVHSASSYLQN